MSMDCDFAPLLTWTCYGTWLPGDERGYVSNTLNPQGEYSPKQNVPGTPIARDDVRTFTQAKRLQKGPTVRLTVEQAVCVAESLVKAAHQRSWQILRAAIMANHVHVVLADCPDDGPGVRRILKGTSQAALSDREGGNRRWWTAGGSDRYRHGKASVASTIRYVADQPYLLVEIIDMQIPFRDNKN